MFSECKVLHPAQSTEAGTQQARLAAIACANPDLIIADLSFKGGEHLEFVKEIRRGSKHVPVLVNCMHDAPLCADFAFRAGTSGYVTQREYV